MNSKPKLIVFRMREAIYTLLLLLLAAMLLVCLFWMFSPGHRQMEQSSTEETSAQTSTEENSSAQSSTESSAQSSTESSAQTSTESSAQTSTESSAQANSTVLPEAELSYTPGVYTVPVFLNDATVDVEVTVDKDHINSIRLVNLGESVAAMYPLMSPSLEHLSAQILQRQTLDHITCPQENRYTSQLLLNAIADALAIAQDKG